LDAFVLDRQARDRVRKDDEVPFPDERRRWRDDSVIAVVAGVSRNRLASVIAPSHKVAISEAELAPRRSIGEVEQNQSVEAEAPDSFPNFPG
jgi:hypothetical protein